MKRGTIPLAPLTGPAKMKTRLNKAPPGCNEPAGYRRTKADLMISNGGSPLINDDSKPYFPSDRSDTPSMQHIVTWCSGIDPVALACLLYLNARVVAQVDIDPLAICVMAHHFGKGVQRFGDINQFTKTGFPFKNVAGGGKVDILWMSPPCQDHSNQNRKKKSINGPNGKVLITNLAVLEATPEEELPDIIIGENVLGFNSKIRNSKSPAPITLMQNCFRKIGYQCVVVRILDASQFGKPAHRKRVFVVASRDPDVAANIMFALEVMMNCQGCADPANLCRLCSIAATENRSADDSVVFTASLHNALSLPLVNILNTETASSGYRMIAASRGRIGVLSISQRLEAMGFPRDYFDFLQDLDNTPNNKKRFKCVTDTVVKLGGFNWRTGAVPRRCCYKDSDKLSPNIILIAGVGAFEVLDVPNCLPTAATYVLPDAFFDLDEMLDLPVHVLTTYLARLAIRGHVIAQELLTRLLLWSPEDSNRILPLVCQDGVSDKMLVGTPCYVFVDSINRYLPAESFEDKRLAAFGRKFPDTELQKGEVFCVLLPVTETGWSKTAEILGIGGEWNGYFKVKKNKLVVSGTAAAVQVFNGSRFELANQGKFENSKEWKILSDAFIFQNELEAVLRDEDGSWNSPAMRILRAIASRHAISSSGPVCRKCIGCLKKNNNSSLLLLCRKRRAAVCAGSIGAYVSELAVAAVGLEVKFWWGSRFLQGKILSYDKRNTTHAIELDISGEERISVSKKSNIGNFMLWAPKCCNLEIKTKKKRKKSAKKSTTSCAVFNLPEIECELCRAAVVRIASQPLINFGKLLDVPDESGTFVEWAAVQGHSPITLGGVGCPQLLQKLQWCWSLECLPITGQHGNDSLLQVVVKRGFTSLRTPGIPQLEYRHFKAGKK